MDIIKGDSSIRTYASPVKKYMTIIISLLMPPLLGHRPSLWITHKEEHNPPRGPSVGWWVLTTANAAGSNGLTCFPKHGVARHNKFLATHPMTDQRCLTSAIVRRSALTAGLSCFSLWTHSFSNNKWKLPFFHGYQKRRLIYTFLR
jgi:hypothetical protein